MPNARGKYFKKRSAQTIQFQVDDPEVKKRLKAAAKADKRSINSWIQAHVLPELLKQLDADRSGKDQT